MSDQYIAGSCNIGKAEVRQRQLLAIVGLFFSVSALAGFITTDAAPSIRLGIFLPLTVFSIGFNLVSVSVWHMASLEHLISGAQERSHA